MGPFFQVKRRLIFLALFALAFLYSPFLIQRFTLGFHPAKLHPRLSTRAEWNGPPLTRDKEAEIVRILDQPFTYFNLGSQCYVFESQDKKHVLKLFRYNRSRFSWIHYLKMGFHRTAQQRVKSSFSTKIDKTFQACSMAYRDVPECTQLVYVHLNPCGSLPEVSLSDPVGRKWTLPLGEYRFALQRKVAPFKATLIQLNESKKMDEMKQLLDSFLALMIERTSKGIRNSDHNLWPNFGFLDGKAVEIDCGNYRKCPELSHFPEMRIHEMERYTTPLFLWLYKHAPEYAHYFHTNCETAYAQIREGVIE
jgi:hypothetical protein